jgi:hypothetical protein
MTSGAYSKYLSMMRRLIAVSATPRRAVFQLFV